MELSDQQKDVVNAPIAPLSVIACAGSGKTTSAVQRLINLRQALTRERGYVALLSFSNVAVNTFRREFLDRSTEVRDRHPYFDRVSIETLDSFISGNILRPHAFRVMQSSCAPFLITGNESFLENKDYKFWAAPKSGKKFPVPPKDIENIAIRFNGKEFSAYYSHRNSLISIDGWKKVVDRLGKIGAYTHEFGKYWVLKGLVDNSQLLSAFAKRYPHIIVDEAQDIDCLHGFILDVLSEAGVKVSLIGDPHQAIYEFTGADGSYLTAFNSLPSTLSFPLSINRRSVKAIVDASNNISGAKTESIRQTEKKEFGAYYCTYKPNQENDLVEAFCNKLDEICIDKSDAAILVRANKLANELHGNISSIGQGKTQLLAKAAIKRDVEGNSLAAFNFVSSCVSSLIDGAPKDFKSRILRSSKGDIYHQTKMLIWKFIRCNDSGLPSSKLPAKSEWHPKLKGNMSSLLKVVCELHGFDYVDKLGNKLSSTKLPDDPFDKNGGLNFSPSKTLVRVDTVHQSKGEGIGAVMYIVTKDHAKKLINGTGTELGRIGYVAITRARDYFVLALPDSSEKELKEELGRIGLMKW